MNRVFNKPKKAEDQVEFVMAKAGLQKKNMTQEARLTPMMKKI